LQVATENVQFSGNSGLETSEVENFEKESGQAVAKHFRGCYKRFPGLLVTK
jgi:hypothetical protein